MATLTGVTSLCSCGLPVISLWRKDGTGCVPRKSYVLLADWVWHTQCWLDIIPLDARDPVNYEVYLDSAPPL